MDTDLTLDGYLTVTPPRVALRPAVPGLQLAGHRAVVILPEGYLRDLRATGPLVRGPIPGVTEPDDTRWHIPVVEEHLWYEHKFTGGLLEPAYKVAQSWPTPAGAHCLAWVE